MSKVAFVFPGQGAQKVGMCKDFYDNYACAKKVFEEADEALGFSISKLCFEGPEEDLRLTKNTQPAILTCSVAALSVMQEHGLECETAGGHSLGEYSALVAAGVMNLQDAVVAVHKRGEFMQEAVPVGEGAMAAVMGMVPDEIVAICQQVEKDCGEAVQAVNFNCPGQIVIAGTTKAVEKAVEALKAAGAKRAVPLPVSAPFHSTLMKPAAERLKEVLDKIEFHDVTGFMYFKSRIIGLAPNKVLKYILIDEAQDYSTLQYKILAMLFRNSNITILGDLNQSIMPFSRHESYDEIIAAIEEYKINCVPQKYELSKTYRSTFEINEFAKKVISYKNNYDQIDRHGDEVEIIKQGEDKNKNVLEILDKARALSKSYKTIAIICKNIGEIEQYSKAIMSFHDKNNFRIVTKNDTVFVEEKIMVIPSYLAKGLEFDAVIVSNANENYYSENERNLLYVVFTRALHKLVVFYTDEFTKLFNGDTDKYLKK